jgi:hypothetical protein
MKDMPVSKPSHSQRLADLKQLLADIILVPNPTTELMAIRMNVETEIANLEKAIAEARVAAIKQTYQRLVPKVDGYN